MKIVNSLQARLALAVGLSITLLWLAAASITVHLVGQEMDEVFDDGLKATAERILSIARHDLSEGRNRTATDHEDDDDEVYRRPQNGRDVRYGEDVSFVVRDRQGQVLMASAGASISIFPSYEKTGFLSTETHRLYYDANSEGTLTIAVAEPLDQRQELSRKMLFGFGLPLLVVIPFSLLAIVLGVRRSFRPLRDFQHGLADRGAQDLSPLPDENLPSELRPISVAVNQLLERLKAAFHAERAFAANAAHELRTPVAGAIAQAQRIRSETKEEQTGQRATEIEASLKRLMRMSEKLMQLARAEGGRLQSDEPSDLRPILQLIVDDFANAGEERIELTMPELPVRSRLDPDAFGILSRNLVENALKHGAQDGSVEVSLCSDGVLGVANDGRPLSPEMMQRLLERFERGNGKISGNGLGLAIVNAIVDRAGATLNVVSPRAMRDDGVEVRVKLPLV